VVTPVVKQYVVPMFFGSVLRDALAPAAVAEALDDFAGPPAVVSHSSSQVLHNLRLRLVFSGILVTFQAAYTAS
jgi:hypothetical protein